MSINADQIHMLIHTFADAQHTDKQTPQCSTPNGSSKAHKEPQDTLTTSSNSSMASSAKHERVNNVSDIFQDCLPQNPSPRKKQKQMQLAFQAGTPKKAKVLVEIDKDAQQALTCARDARQATKAEVAKEWGLPWPRHAGKDHRRGGPMPKSLKWTNGLYVWLEKVAQGELPKPTTAPVLQYPVDWQHKCCQPWEYTPPPASKKEEEVPEAPEGESGKEPGAQESKEHSKGKTYHKYRPEVVQFYFDCERNMGGPPNSVVNFVKEHYPSLFPSVFNESRVRYWEKKQKTPEGKGKGWRMGNVVIGLGHLAFLGSLILAQYQAGVPMTSRLLVPLIAGALAAKGLGDKAGLPV